MPIDRGATLRNAEKLLRQGKLDLAIAEYVRVVEEQPTDWNTANALGDLYVRAGKTDKGIGEYLRIADHLKEEGFLPKAGALYKKILKIRPDHEHALLQWAEVAASQGLLADARNALNNVAERRRGRGDQRGVAQIRIRLGTLDPADFKARANGARARVEIGDTGGAVGELTALAADLREKGRDAEAIEVLQEALLLKPDDNDIRGPLVAACLASGDLERARQSAGSADQLKSVAAALEAAGDPDEALAARREAARLDPADFSLKEALARALVWRGDFAAAAEYLTAEVAGDDVRLLLTVAEIRMRSRDVAGGLAVVKSALEKDPATREAVALLGWKIAEAMPDAGFRTVEMAADAAVTQSDWPSAAAALQEFVTRVPNHVPALMRLVEICVDGGLEATMQSAQAELADAYLATGAATEARLIAEDLVAREPWNRANVERFRQALVLLGEPDPDALIAERLSGESPFTSTDRSVADSPAEKAQEGTLPPAPVVEASPLSASRQESGHLGPSGGAHSAIENPQSAEVDLSVVLEDFKAGQARPSTSGIQAAPSPAEALDADSQLAQLRREASRRSAIDAEAQYKAALEFRAAGQIDEAIGALHAASQLPRLRFQAASLLARIYRERELLPQAIEWFERAAQAPAPTVEEAHLLLFELADTLEMVGETARALAICLELQAEAGDYRDLPARIDRLAKVQTRG